MYFISYFLPATAISSTKEFVTLVVNYFEVIKENLISFMILLIIALLIVVFHKNKEISIFLFLILLVSYLWVTVSNAISLFYAVSKIYGYYVTTILGLCAILSWGTVIMNYHGINNLKQIKFK